ncbi:MAG: aspartate dehydrogenase domain-containing protein, partial [Arenibacterium sp.]
LRITMRGPEITEAWNGSLRYAIERWPNQLNTAVAAALNGPGLDATELIMEHSSPGIPHEIALEAEAGGITWQRTVRFDMSTGTPHPVAQMLLTELARDSSAWQGV